MQQEQQRQVQGLVHEIKGDTAGPGEEVTIEEVWAVIERRELKCTERM